MGCFICYALISYKLISWVGQAEIIIKYHEILVSYPGTSPLITILMTHSDSGYNEYIFSRISQLQYICSKLWLKSFTFGLASFNIFCHGLDCETDAQLSYFKHFRIPSALICFRWSSLFYHWCYESWHQSVMRANNWYLEFNNLSEPSLQIFEGFEPILGRFARLQPGEDWVFAYVLLIIFAILSCKSARPNKLNFFPHHDSTKQRFHKQFPTTLKA